MTAKTDLLPCPFCGLDVTDDEGCFPLNREGTRWEVRCGNPSCFAYDPCDESMQAAVARWNRRATAARDAEIEALRAEVERLAEALKCMIIGACAVAVPHNGERAVLQDAVNIARAALAAQNQEPNDVDRR